MDGGWEVFLWWVGAPVDESLPCNLEAMCWLAGWALGGVHLHGQECRVGMAWHHLQGCVRV